MKKRVNKATSEAEKRKRAESRVKEGSGKMTFIVEDDNIRVQAALKLNPGQVMHLSQVLQKQAMTIKLGMLREMAKDSGLTF